jgi:hypothetical protein
MRRLSSAVSVLCIVILGGCGGGGGGGGSSSVSYKGVTTEALVTSTNAQDFASLAAGGADLQSVGGIAFRQSADAQAPTRQGPVLAASGLGDTVVQLLGARQASRAQKMVSGSQTDPGPCGGSATLNISADDQTGAFTGSVGFHDYCDQGVINGGAHFTGQMNLASMQPDYLTLSFGSLTFEDAGDHMAMGGTMRFDFGYPTTNFQMTVNVRDEVMGKTVRFQDYALSATDTGDGSDVVMTGRCYHPDYGYVELSTPETLHIGPSDMYPSSGSVQGDGASGTRMLVTAVNASQCRVQADTNGDGAVEWDSGIMLWTDL